MNDNVVVAFAMMCGGFMFDLPWGKPPEFVNEKGFKWWQDKEPAQLIWIRPNRLEDSAHL